MVVGLHGEHQTRPHRFTVEEHGAGPTDTVLATDVGSRQGQVLAQEVAQQQSRLHDTPARRAVDGYRD
jgi:hypothetical protein